MRRSRMKPSPKPWLARRRRAGLARRKPVNKVGPRTRASNKARAVNKARDERNNETTCEVRLPGCLVNMAIDYSHGRKRRELLPGELESFVVRACRHCHNEMELKLSHEALAAKHQEIIESRQTRLPEYA
jgi:hypothetical protein